jgi:hypothetical protein
MMIEAEQTVTASTVPVALHNPTPNVGRQTLLIKNTSANAATLLVGTPATTRAADLAASASVVVTVDYGETVNAKRSGGTDATLSVLRWYGR